MPLDAEDGEVLLPDMAGLAGRDSSLLGAIVSQPPGAPGVAVPGDDGLEVFCRRRERIQVKEAKEFRRTRSVRPWRIFPEDIAPRCGRASSS